MKALKTIVAAGALGIFVFLAGFVLFAASIAGYSRDGLSGRGAPADAIVVLTGGEHRLAEGMRLFAEGSARRLLVSGVNRSTSRDDVRRIAGLAPELFDCCIDIGYGALDTIGDRKSVV